VNLCALIAFEMLDLCVKQHAKRQHYVSTFKGIHQLFDVEKDLYEQLKILKKQFW